MILAASLLFAGALASQIPTIPTHNGLTAWFDVTDPAYQRYEFLREHFGNDNYVICAFEVEDAFADSALEQIDTLTEALARLPGVDEVRSLTEVENIWLDEAQDVVMVGDLLRSLPADPGTIARARLELDSNPLLHGTVVSGDGRVAAVIARLESLESEDEANALVIEIRHTSTRVLGFEPALIGLPVFDEGFARLSERDLARLVPAVLATMAVLLGVLYRSLAATLAPIVIAALSTTCALGVLALAGGTMNILASTIPLVLLVVGLSSSVHVLSRYRAQLARGVDAGEALADTIGLVAAPCVIASATTAIGFLSFATSEIPPVVQYGIYTAVGVSFSCLLALTFLPAALSLLPALAPVAPGRGAAGFAGLARLVRRRSTAIVALFAASACLSGFGIARLEFNERHVDYFPEDDALPHSLDFVETHFHGVATFETVFRGEPGALNSSVLLGAMDGYAEFLSGRDGIDRTLATSDFVKRIHQVMDDGTDALPTSDSAVAQYYLMLEGPGRDIESYLDGAHALGRVTAYVPVTDSNRFRWLVETADAYLEQLDLPVETFITGYSELNFRMLQHVSQSQVRTVALALPLVVLVVTLLFRRARVVPLVAVATAFPALVTLAVMGFQEVPLNTGTILVAAVSLGVVVDDAVYLLAELRAHRRLGLDIDTAIERSLTVIGPALRNTSILACVGFAVLGFADFQPLRQQGILIGLSLATAFVTDVLLLPALICKMPALLD